MTGAGSALPVAFTMEDEFMGDLESDDDPTFYEPGLEPQVEELDLQRQLERLRAPDDPIPMTSVMQNLEGAASVSFYLAGDNWHDLVFDDDGEIGKGLRPSARWYFGVDLIDETVKRVTVGTIVADVQIQYQQDQSVRVTLTMLYGSEPDDLDDDFDAEALERPSKSDIYASHGTSLEIDGSAVEAYLQSADLSVSQIGRFRTGAGARPVDAVTGAVEPELSTDAIFTETDRHEIATCGGEPASMLEEVDATLEFENANEDEIGYELEAKPDNYAWNDLVESDTDLTEDITWHVSSLEVV